MNSEEKEILTDRFSSKDKSNRDLSKMPIKRSLFYKPLFHIFLIGVIGFLAYSNTFNVPFQFDDGYIVENYNNLKDLKKFLFLTGTRWFGNLTFAFNLNFGGLNVAGYHIVNLIIHILTALLVYYLVVTSFKTPFLRNREPEIKEKINTDQLIALFSGLFFISHPVQTQAVTYIIQRFASLSTLLYLLSLVMYMKWRLIIQGALQTDQNPGKWGKIFNPKSLPFYLVSIISAIFSMKTKEISFTLPFTIALYEFFFFSTSDRADFKTYNLIRVLFLIPFLLTLLIIPMSLVDTGRPIGDIIGELRDAARETERIPRWSYLITQFRVIVTYLRLLFLPVNQSLIYDYPVYHSFLDPKIILSSFLLLSIFTLAVYLFYKSGYSYYKEGNKYYKFRLISFGIFWFFMTLSVESSVIPIRDVIFEHRLYLPSIGIIIAFTTAIFSVLEHNLHKHKSFATALTLIMAVIVTVFSTATYKRNIVWQDQVRLWEDALGKLNKPGLAPVHFNLAIAYRDKGFADKAVEHYEIAISLNPDFAEAHNNLGSIYSEKGIIDGAIHEYLISLRLKPDFAEAHNNLGNALRSRGLLDEAIEHYMKALKSNPDFAEAYSDLGAAYHDKGMVEKAIGYYLTALRLKPDNASIHNNIGTAYTDLGLTDKAIEHYRTALRLNPNNASVHYNLGATFMKIGLKDEAIKEFETSLRLKPDLKSARQSLESLMK